jgi:hypothetical protein
MDKFMLDWMIKYAEHHKVDTKKIIRKERLKKFKKIFKKFYEI